jgi:hypothetical protein
VSALLQSSPIDETGVLSTDGTAAPEYFANGLPYDAGKLAVDAITAIDHYHQGLPFTAVGRLAIIEADPTYYGSGAAPFNASRLCVGGLPIDHYASGVPYITS